MDTSCELAGSRTANFAHPPPVGWVISRSQRGSCVSSGVLRADYSRYGGLKNLKAFFKPHFAHPLNFYSG